MSKPETYTAKISLRQGDIVNIIANFFGADTKNVQLYQQPHGIVCEITKEMDFQEKPEPKPEPVVVPLPYYPSYPNWNPNWNQITTTCDLSADNTVTGETQDESKDYPTYLDYPLK